jgi:hypothetical protein
MGPVVVSDPVPEEAPEPVVVPEPVPEEVPELCPVEDEDAPDPDVGVLLELCPVDGPVLCIRKIPPITKAARAPPPNSSSWFFVIFDTSRNAK